MILAVWIGDDIGGVDWQEPFTDRRLPARCVGLGRPWHEGVCFGDVGYSVVVARFGSYSLMVGESH